MEVYHTHRTDAAKRDEVWTRGWFFAEFDAAHVVGQLERPGGLVCLDNLAPMPVVCAYCIRHERVLESLRFYAETVLDAWAVATTHWVGFDNEIGEGYYDAYWGWMCHLHHKKFKAVQSSGFRAAEGHLLALENAGIDLNAPKVKPGYCYSKGDFKCFLCAKWRSPRDRRVVAGSNWTLEGFVAVTGWDRVADHTDKEIPCCDVCTVPRVRCHENQPLEHALKYGLCYDCNRARFATEPE